MTFAVVHQYFLEGKVRNGNLKEMKAIRTANYNEINSLCDEIAREFRPLKNILFGSHAYGKPEWDSDVDLLVIMPFKGTPHRQAVAIRSRIEAGVALDLLVRTPQQISRRLAMGDLLIRERLERGKVFYEADHQGSTRPVTANRAAS